MSTDDLFSNVPVSNSARSGNPNRQSVAQIALVEPVSPVEN